jgi:hypothetical protein
MPLLQIEIPVYVVEYSEVIRGDDRFWDGDDVSSYNIVYVPKWINSAEILTNLNYNEFIEYVKNDKIIEIKTNATKLDYHSLPKDIRIKYSVKLEKDYSPANSDVLKVIPNKDTFYILKDPTVNYDNTLHNKIKEIDYNISDLYTEYKKAERQKKELLKASEIKSNEKEFFEKIKNRILLKKELFFKEVKEKYPVFFEFIKIDFDINVKKTNEYYLEFVFSNGQDSVTFNFYYEDIRNTANKIKEFIEETIKYFSKEFFEKLKYKLLWEIREILDDLKIQENNSVYDNIDYDIIIKQVNDSYKLSILFFDTAKEKFESVLVLDLIQSQNYKTEIINFLKEFVYKKFGNYAEDFKREYIDDIEKILSELKEYNINYEINFKSKGSFELRIKIITEFDEENLYYSQSEIESYKAEKEIQRRVEYIIKTTLEKRKHEREIKDAQETALKTGNLVTVYFDKKRQNPIEYKLEGNTIRVPEKAILHLIGKGGREIKRVQEKLGKRINVVSNGDKEYVYFAQWNV